MAAQPEYPVPGPDEGVAWACPDCGGPMDPATEAGHRICQGCWEANVDHAGR